MDDFLDHDELDADIGFVGRSPGEICQEQFNDIYKRNLWMYLNSIEWDTWCKKETPEETTKRLKELERSLHPFKKFF